MAVLHETGLDVPGDILALRRVFVAELQFLHLSPLTTTLS